MTYREAMSFGEEQLNNAGIVDAKTDAWILLTYVCKIDRTFYYVHMDEEMLPEQLAEYTAILGKRAEHVPLQYITGEQEFMGITFHVNEAVLIPRQDTETLVEEALKIVRPGMKVLDMCTGSGCILISILKNVVDVEGHGCDISKQALNVAKENAMATAGEYINDIKIVYGVTLIQADGVNCDAELVVRFNGIMEKADGSIDLAIETGTMISASHKDKFIKDIVRNKNTGDDYESTKILE